MHVWAMTTLSPAAAVIELTEADITARELAPDRATRFTECRACGQPAEWLDSPSGGWWAHLHHPADGHDVDPILPYTDERATLTAEWALAAQDNDRSALTAILWRAAGGRGIPAADELIDFVRPAEQIIANAAAERTSS